MEKKIKVSVLMLTYNHEKYIDDAIKSVVAQQTDFPIEVVIGNDCSTDNTGALCARWKEKYPDEIRFIDRLQNLGLQQNFIQTYAQCRGEYVAICEGDDYWTDRNKLQKQAGFLDAHPQYSLCFHRVVNYYEDTGTKSLSNGRQKVHTTILDLAASNYITNVSAVFRRGLFALPAWFSEVSTYDYALHLLNAQYGDIYYFKKPMAVYRQHGGAIWSMAPDDKKLKIALRIRELLMAHFEGREDVYRRLQKSHAQITANLNNPRRTAARINLRSILKWVRATLSRLIPVPRACSPK